MNFPTEPIDQFLAVSSVLTGYSHTDLVATGLAETYWNELVSIVGSPLAGDFLSACGDAFRQSTSLEALETRLEQGVLTDPKLGPLGRNLITLWYLGQWQQLPRDWRDRFGGTPADNTHVVSPKAYQAGLVWPTFGSHPQGAKAPGFGSWTEPPPLPRP